MTEAELAIVRRAYAKQMLAVFGGTDPRVEAASATSLRASGWSSISARTAKRMNDLLSAKWNVRGSASIGCVAVPLGQNPEGHEESPYRQWRRIY
jgi:hypothetical protein